MAKNKYIKDIQQERFFNTRRAFLKKTTQGLGFAALATLINPTSLFAEGGGNGVLKNLHHIAKAKRIIYLFQAGGPSQIETFDYKPVLNQRWGEEIPKSLIGGQQLTGMVKGQASFPLVGSYYDFKQYGKAGTWVSEIFPYTAEIVDDICVVNSMYTDAINHEPAVIFFQSGSQQVGRPSFGSWLSYGLGSENQNLPAFIVMVSQGQLSSQNLNPKSWSNGFLSSYHQGVQFRAGKDPVLYINNPDGISKGGRRSELDYLAELDALQKNRTGDVEIDSKISQYEMAFRMQTSVPDVVDVSNEPDYIFDMYGPEARIPGTYARNCLLARKLAEQDVRFIQLYHKGWDQHGNLPHDIGVMAKETDQPTAALIKDLKQRGLLEDTLVIWGGEFGRTSFSQGKLTKGNYGRDHHSKCMSMWMAGGGIKAGITYGKTDDFSYKVAENPVHVHDFQATALHQMGIDHERFTFKHQGRRYRLTDVHGHVVKDILV